MVETRATAVVPEDEETQARATRTTTSTTTTSTTSSSAGSAGTTLGAPSTTDVSAGGLADTDNPDAGSTTAVNDTIVRSALDNVAPSSVDNVAPSHVGAHGLINMRVPPCLYDPAVCTLVTRAHAEQADMPFLVPDGFDAIYFPTAMLVNRAPVNDRQPTSRVLSSGLPRFLKLEHVKALMRLWNPGNLLMFLRLVYAAVESLPENTDLSSALYKLLPAWVCNELQGKVVTYAVLKLHLTTLCLQRFDPALVEQYIELLAFALDSVAVAGCYPHLAVCRVMNELGQMCASFTIVKDSKVFHPMIIIDQMKAVFGVPPLRPLFERLRQQAIDEGGEEQSAEEQVMRFFSLVADVDNVRQQLERQLPFCSTSRTSMPVSDVVVVTWNAFKPTKRSREDTPTDAGGRKKSKPTNKVHFAPTDGAETDQPPTGQNGSHVQANRRGGQQNGGQQNGGQQNGGRSSRRRNGGQASDICRRQPCIGQPEHPFVQCPRLKCHKCNEIGHAEAVCPKPGNR